MAITVDPDEREVAALRRAAKWNGTRALEIGCGDGRLTLRLASLGARVVALDPDRLLIHKAREGLPSRYSRQVNYSVGSASKLRHPPASFDIVVFAWSL